MTTYTLYGEGARNWTVRCNAIAPPVCSGTKEKCEEWIRNYEALGDPDDIAPLEDFVPPASEPEKRRVRVTFEMDWDTTVGNAHPEKWNWRTALSDVNSEGDEVDFDTLTVTDL